MDAGPSVDVPMYFILDESSGTVDPEVPEVQAEPEDEDDPDDAPASGLTTAARDIQRFWI